ncbi:MAG: RNA polymerase sigma factor [Cyclobacteriaceae bacterium]
MRDQTIEIAHPKRKPSTYEIFERELLPHYDYLYAYAVRSLRDTDMAKDILQDVYAQAFQYIDRYEAGTNGSAWLFKILRNRLIYEYHKIKAGQRLIRMDFTEAEQAGLLKFSANPASYSVVVDDLFVVAFNELKAEFKAVLTLHDFHGYDYVEISHILAIPVGTVRSRIYYAKKTLMSKLPPAKEDFLEEKLSF